MCKTLRYIILLKLKIVQVFSNIYQECQWTNELVIAQMNFVFRSPSYFITDRAGFKPIWPISSQQTRRKMGAPRSVYWPKQTYTFYRSCLCIVPALSPAFFKSLWETKTVLTFFQRSLKSTVKTRFSITIKVHQNFALQSFRYSDEQLRSLKMSLQSARSNWKLWRGPQYFVSVRSVANENPSVLRGV